ncbi:MAG: flagellar basal body P-ring formation protein FlgA [Roseomonas sp.]|nr:flagellar basal body P-ring formation protein FlgA [Roseomonas sp.]MCA3386650.1 flagellar basal body P-ring formation protein FlgA [Roseomonas sp.]MCA3395597.1 flagellar basal body P-ring formation protein FlgA [Roseomonas sp.]MCA3399794.1 flagellar basal body P-ring formation protein FlgA [Roseomonas sp.]
MRRRLLLLLPVGLLGLPVSVRAQVAVLRSHTLVEDQVIRIGDIFEGTPRGDVVVGAAPAPGQRFVLEAGQLAAIARRFAVEWRPTSGAERSVIERPGRALSREAALEALRSELLGLGLPADSELELAVFSPPILPLNALPRVSAEGGNYEMASNRFAATLVVMADGMPTIRMRLAGRAIATAPAVVATRRLSVGDVVGPDDVRLVQLRAERVRPGTAQRLEDVVGMQLRRPISTDLPFMGADLMTPHIIAKNEVVLMVVEGPALSLTTQGRALEPASRGGRLSVMNLSSRNVVEAEAIGPGRVRVRLGASPLRTADRS